MDLIIAQSVAILSAGGLVFLGLYRLFSKGRRVNAPIVKATVQIREPETKMENELPGESVPRIKSARVMTLNLSKFMGYSSGLVKAGYKWLRTQGVSKLKVIGQRAVNKSKSHLDKAFKMTLRAYEQGQPKLRQGFKQSQVILGKSSKAGMGIIKKTADWAGEQVQSTYDTVQHIKMRQREHKERLQERRNFLGDLATKVNESRKSEASHQSKAAGANATEDINKLLPADEPVVEMPSSLASHDDMDNNEKTNGAENRERMENILREQEAILIKQIVKNPKDIALYKRLGFVYLELSEWGDAKECFEQAMKLGSQDPIIRHELKRLYQFNN